MDDNILGMEKEFEIKQLKDEIEKLQNQITKQNILLKEMGHDGVVDISDEEAICVQQIARMKERSDQMEFDNEDTKKLESLVKTLLSIRGKNPRNIKKNMAKNKSTEDLIEAATKSEE